MISLAEKPVSDLNAAVRACDDACAAAASALERAVAERRALADAEAKCPPTLEAHARLIEQQDAADAKVRSTMGMVDDARRAKKDADGRLLIANTGAEREALDAKSVAVLQEFLANYEAPSTAIATAMATAWALQKVAARRRIEVPERLTGAAFCNVMRLPRITRKNGLQGYLHYPCPPAELDKRKPDAEFLDGLDLASRGRAADDVGRLRKVIGGALEQLAARYEASVREIAKLIAMELAIRQPIDEFNATKGWVRGVKAVPLPAERQTNWRLFSEHICLPAILERKPFWSPSSGMSEEMARSL